MLLQENHAHLLSTDDSCVGPPVSNRSEADLLLMHSQNSLLWKDTALLRASVFFGDNIVNE